MSYSKFGSVEFRGETIRLASQAEPTRRLLASSNYNDRHQNDGEYNFEMSAEGVNAKGMEVTVYWIFENVEGAELDSYDYDDVDRVAIND